MSDVKKPAHEIVAEHIVKLTEELATLRAKLDRLRGSEPVGCMSKDEFERMICGTVENGECFRIWQMDNPPSRAKAGVKLYTHPAPQDDARDAEVLRIADAMESVSGHGAPYASASVPRYAVLGWVEQIRKAIAEKEKSQ